MIAVCETKNESANLTKVGEHLYRYKPNKKYYAVFRINGKLHWKSLKTSDRELASRRLKDESRRFARLYDQSLAKYD